MSRLSPADQQRVRDAIIEAPNKSNKEIASELDVPIRTVASLRRSLQKKTRFSVISKDKRAKARRLIKLGRSDKDISQELGIQVDDVILIRNQISTSVKFNSFNKVKRVESKMIDPVYIEDLLLETARLITQETGKSDFLLFRESSQTSFSPREIDVRNVMTKVLSRDGYYHMIESPTMDYDDIKVKGSVDLSIFSSQRQRLVDVEFKENYDEASRDFLKLFRSNAEGVVEFFLFNKQSIDFAMPNILNAYADAYNRIKKDISETVVRDKWFHFFLLSSRERRAYSHLYKSIMSIDWGLIPKSEIGG